MDECKLGKILSALMSSRTVDFCRRNAGASINQTRRLFSADSFEYFPRPAVSCCAPSDPIVVQSAEEKYRNTEIQKYRTPQNTERARYWLPLASLHPDNRFRWEGWSEQWWVVRSQMKTNHLLKLCEPVMRKAVFFTGGKGRVCQMF